MSFIHASADVADCMIGEGTRIWQFVVILVGAQIGRDCNICSHVLVEGDVTVGDRVTIKSGVQLWNGFVLEETIIEHGASIGAGAVILPGICIGKGAMVGAGAVVTKNVEPHSLVVGNPARHVRYLDDEAL